MQTNETQKPRRVFRYRWGNGSTGYRCYTDITEITDISNVPLHFGIGSLEAGGKGLSAGTSFLAGMGAAAPSSTRGWETGLPRPI